MRVKNILTIALVLSSLCVGCDDETQKLNITNFEKPTLTVDTVSVSNKNVGVVLSGSYKTSNSDEKISECGFYYYSENDKKNVIKTQAVSVNHSFSTDLLLKEYGTTYYYKAYITNGIYEIESKEKSFKLLDFKDYVVISDPNIVTSDGGTVVIKSDIKQADGVDVTEKGIIVGKSDRLTIDSTHYQDKTQASNVNVTIEGLTIGAKYFFSTYIKENEYIAYGRPISFIPHTVPTISTVQVNNIDYYSAFSGGYNISGNGLDIITKGVVWSKTEKPTVEESFIKSLDISDLNDFTCQLTDLDPGTTYYVRAFATNSDGTGYGEEFSFNTIALKKATINTGSISAVTSYSASIGGEVISDGGTPVTERGVVLNTTHNPTIESELKVTSGEGLGEFTCSLSNLSPGITYYVRAYAINSLGVEYGSEESFTTLTTIPTVITLDASEITSSSVYIGGNVTASGGADVTDRGIVWSTSDNPTIDNNKKTIGKGVGEFAVVLSELDFATTYYVRAYAINSAGVSYGSSVKFTTSSVVPILSTTTISSVTSSSAISGGNITSDGGEDVTARGVVWSKQQNPTINLTTKTNDGTGPGSFSSRITDLEPGVTYFVRAYATNSVGTAYGSEESFTTLATIPTVSTSAASDITSSSVKIGGSVTFAGGAVITERGIVWGTSLNPTVDGSKKSSGSGLGDFSVTLSDLSFATTYYVRAYAINSAGVAYGNSVEFTTNAILPALTTEAATSITSSSAVSGGNITSDGGAAVTARGVVWSKQQNPTVSLSTKTSNGDGTGTFSSSITGLEPGVKYYVRAYATNSVGTAYGAEESFTTLATIPTVITSAATDIAPTSAKLGGSVTATGGAEVSERGIVWGKSENPTIDNNKEASGSGLGEFSVTLSGLSIATTYYVRAYAVNSAGVAYGEMIQFTTGTVKPSLTTTAATSITSSSAVSGGNITSDGGAAVTSRGVVWSIEHNPTISLSTKTSNGNGIGTFSSNITGLEPGITYYVRAYATNSVGTAYGSEESFTTLATIPTVSTSAVSSITSSSAKVGGNVTATGGADVTERGVVWGTSENPTVDDNKKASGSDIGEFSLTLSDLTFATTYYVRAYAINSEGVSYGNSVEFSTSSVVPILSTTSVTSITSNSAKAGGNISNNGGADVTARGVIWSKENNPTVDLSTKTNDGTGSGLFTSTITGLEPGVTYYVRAYATNSVGTAYGSEVSFITLATVPSVITSAASDITSSSAKIAGTVTATGGADVTERGIVWGTSENPTVDDNKKASGSGLGEFSVTLSELSIATTYFVRAYAINSAGIAYGEIIQFITRKVEPTVSTESISSITSSSAVSGGNITSDGGASVTARGVVWSKENNPTISLATKTTDGTGTGKYSSTITGLEPGVTYYVRAYATNSVGTAYGSEVSFTTDIVLPEVTTNTASSITSTSFSIGGNVTYNGGGTITARGVIWSTSESPTVSLSTKTTDGTGTGTFTSSVTDLQPNTVYYVRAYATNAKGTAYGEEITVQTKAKGSNEDVGNEDYTW